MQHNENIISLIDIESEASKTLVKMQLRKKDDKSKWAKDARKFCLSLFYKSPSAYMYLLRQDIRLAAPSTLRQWLAKTSTPPGISKEIFYNIKEKFEHSSFLERACVVSFDEMSIMRSLEYSKTRDYIEGLEDYGSGHRTNKIAKNVLVFVVRGLYKSWKMPIAYFLSSGNVKAEMLNQDVCENLFARFRQKSGSNRNPTAKQLRTIFRSSIVNSLIKLPSSKNCEDEDGTFIECPTNVQPMPSKASEETTAQPSCSNKTPSRRILLSEVETVTQQVRCSEQSDDHEPATLEHCSVTYFAGYLAMHLLKNNVCDICYQTLQKKEAFLNSEKELLILNKSFSFNKTIKLKMPSDNLIKLVSLALDAFNLNFEKMLHHINLKSQLSKHILQFLSSEAAQLLNFTCYDHVVSIINQLITVKVNFYCKTSNMKF
ncbi:unnamed protein product [Colias eurytheme]|nr:unnamed protein product [Colias eurytheme]